MGEGMVMMRLACTALLVLVGCSESDPEGPSVSDSEAASPTSQATSTSSSPETLTSTPEPHAGNASPLVGHWTDQGGARFHFVDDGTFAVNDGAYEQGTYEFDGETLILSTTDDSRYCASDVATYDVVFYDEAELADLEMIEDPCPQRRGILASGPIERSRP